MYYDPSHLRLFSHSVSIGIALCSVPSSKPWWIPPEGTPKWQTFGLWEMGVYGYLLPYPPGVLCSSHADDAVKISISTASHKYKVSLGQWSSNKRACLAQLSYMLISVEGWGRRYQTLLNPPCLIVISPSICHATLWGLGMPIIPRAVNRDLPRCHIPALYSSWPLKMLWLLDH